MIIFKMGDPRRHANHLFNAFWDHSIAWNLRQTKSSADEFLFEHVNFPLPGWFVLCINSCAPKISVKRLWAIEAPKHYHFIVLCLFSLCAVLHSPYVKLRAVGCVSMVESHQIISLCGCEFHESHWWFPLKPNQWLMLTSYILKI